MRNRDEEEAVGRVRDTGQGIVPSRKRSEDAKRAASQDATMLWGATVRTVQQVSNTQHQEGHVQSKEEEEEGDR